MTPPLVFIHYGKSHYLRQTLRSAASSNPDKRIFFLGDNSNRTIAKNFADLTEFKYLENVKTVEFDRVFQSIQGSDHKFNKLGGTQRWLNFVFKRWFYIAELLRRKNVRSFWTFDSDTLVLAPLGLREERFRGYESTTQCRDCCLNGFIGSLDLVDRYTTCIINLFKDERFLAGQRERLTSQSGLAFNEMDAFCEFRRREEVKTFHAAQPHCGEFFDDALAYDRAFEESSYKIRGCIPVKRLWSDRHGAVYARHLESSRFVRMVTANLSWLPDYVGRKLARFCLTPDQDAKILPPAVIDLQEIDLSQPLTDKIADTLKGKFSKLRRLTECR